MLTLEGTETTVTERLKLFSPAGVPGRVHLFESKTPD